MEETLPLQAPEPPHAESMSHPAPAENKEVSLSARLAERFWELRESELAKPDPRQAVLGSARAEALEFAGVLKAAMMEVAAATSDPNERISKLTPPLRMYANLLRLGDRQS